jgi:sec-independent protein translocase protein TatA
MFRGIFQPIHRLVVLGLVLLIFGPKNIGRLGAGLSRSICDFKKALNPEEDKVIEINPEIRKKE